MQLDPEDLIAQFRKDWPAEFEWSTLRLRVEMQDREIQRLSALQDGAYNPSGVRPYVGNGLPADDDGVRHGG